MKDELIEFMNVAVEACEGLDATCMFRCPICGGQAWVVQKGCDERYAGVCEECGMQFAE